MNYNPILIVGVSQQYFSEIYFKTLNIVKIKRPIIIISSKKIIEMQMDKLKVKRKLE